MFSKASKPPRVPPLPDSLPESGVPVSAEEPRPGVPSIISADLKIVGDLNSGGDLQIDGAVEGDITSRSLTIGESAVVRGVMVAETGAGVRVAVTGAGPCVFRVAEMESALSADFSADAVAGISVSDADLNADIHASAEYRAHLVTVMAKRAVAAAG